MPGHLATYVLCQWVQQMCYFEPGLGKNHNFVTPNFKFRFSLRRRGGHGQNAQRQFFCLARGVDCPGDLEGDGHLCDPVTTE